MMRVLIAGCGYLGLALGARLATAGHAVAGLRRPGSDITALTCHGVEPILADLAVPSTLQSIALRSWDWVVHCAAPRTSTESDYRAVYVDGLRHLIATLEPRKPKAMVMVGSTSVYGQTDGSRVDESAPAEPIAQGGRVLLEAEALVQQAARNGWRSMVLRSAGIYGPGRNRLPALRRGELRTRGNAARWVNLVHRDDLATAIIAAFERGQPGAVYNVADGCEATEAEFVTWLEQRFGPGSAANTGVHDTTAPPPQPRPGRRATNKRVVAERARRELGWAPAYPDFRAGYEALRDEVVTGSPD